MLIPACFLKTVINETLKRIWVFELFSLSKKSRNWEVFSGGEQVKKATEKDVQEPCQRERMSGVC